MPALFIDPGSLSRELLLEKSTITADDTGELVENWVEIASVWAQIEPMESGLRILGEQGLPEITHRITLRMRSDIASTMRLRKGLRIFQILTLHDPDDSGRYLVCRVREESR
ncbi:phage head closure protein [Phyllobacterium bourgognense]|uniref:SPP1 family predicted phage head-tail adaptor n=1 Tax=Phyllobacterium bourgognense TaxID=314236 RepID=A0A368YIV5_9HYPH|nr:phage head closure protein [Phyllobacterium bourgognense]RCW79549.1 SPP1 family predicted phage head-tail adaptor [Phyllobacterium bourgognense]